MCYRREMSLVKIIFEKIKETQGKWDLSSLVAQKFEEFKCQIEFDFAPEPSTLGLIWQLSERKFGS
jgi:hypothetical protein